MGVCSFEAHAITRPRRTHIRSLYTFICLPLTAADATDAAAANTEMYFISIAFMFDTQAVSYYYSECVHNDARLRQHAIDMLRARNQDGGVMAEFLCL